MARAKEQLKFMGYQQPYLGIGASTGLAWYNHGELLGFERVYITLIDFQQKSHGPVVNVEVVEDARTGNIVSAFSLGNYLPVF